MQEKTYQEKLKESWKDGMLYKFYSWITKKNKQKGEIKNETNKR